LPTLDALLTRQIGPMAKFLLKKVAVKADDMDTLCDLLLPHIPSELGRVQFRASVDQLKKKLDSSGTGSNTRSNTGSGISSSGTRHGASGSLSASTAVVTPARATIGFDEAFVDATARQLTAFIGPIARVVAKRAMRQTQDKTEFLRLMAEQIASLPERSRFLIEASGN